MLNNFYIPRLIIIQHFLLFFGDIKSNPIHLSLRVAGQKEQMCGEQIGESEAESERVLAKEREELASLLHKQKEERGTSLPFYQCSGFVTFWNGSGSVDPYH